MANFIRVRNFEINLDLVTRIEIVRVAKEYPYNTVTLFFANGEHLFFIKQDADQAIEAVKMQKTKLTETNPTGTAELAERGE